MQNLSRNFLYDRLVETLWHKKTMNWFRSIQVYYSNCNHSSKENHQEGPLARNRKAPQEDAVKKVMYEKIPNYSTSSDLIKNKKKYKTVQEQVHNHCL